MRHSVEQIASILANFHIDGAFIHAEQYGNGHINDTYAVYYRNGSRERYILQRINHHVFKNPPELMQNIAGVTRHIAEKVKQEGGNPLRETLTIVKTHDGALYYMDADECYWRLYVFIEDTACYQVPEDNELFCQTAVAFGRFQQMLADYPVHTLHESIPRFHDMRWRIKNLKDAIDNNPVGRTESARAEIAFAKSRFDDASALVRFVETGKLPMRVTHNDTKLNNVLFDNRTKRGICVVDLDTVMPGISLFDFGDSIRSGANTAAEDERNLDKVTVSLDLFDTYCRGYLPQAVLALNPTELDNLALSAKIMTFECGIRFLTDYLDGDKYFRIHREGHNLDRCRTQFKLVADMESKMSRMRTIVEKHAASAI